MGHEKARRSVLFSILSDPGRSRFASAGEASVPLCFLLTKSGVYVIIKAKEKKTRNIMAVYRCKRCKTASDCGPDAEYCVCRMCGKRQKLPRSFKKLFSPGYDAEKAAKRKKRIKTAVILFVIFCAVFSVLLFSVIIPEIKYGKAVRSYDSGDYEQALAAFRSLKGYRDSYDQIDKCKEAIKEGVYQNAKELYEKGEYEEALKAFKPLNGYKDSGDYIDLCGRAVTDIVYNRAVASIGKGDVVEIYETLIGLDGYKDSAEKASGIFDEYKKAKLGSADIGDVIYFGGYEQDNDASDGKEDIEWRVLDKDGDRLLIISKYALDCHKYNEVEADVTWETCSLRSWLNETFINEAFDEKERERIISSVVKADENPAFSVPVGRDTTDRIFVLSAAEVYRYFASSEDRMCKPTDYAIARGAGTGNSYEDFRLILCWWVLRTPGYYPGYTSFVFYSGYVNLYGYEVSLPSDAIRPALWIDTKK